MRIALPAFVIAALLFTGVGCLPSSSAKIVPMTLEYWRTEDEPEALKDAIEAYQKLHPNVTIKVTMIRGEEYEKKLLEALAVDKGPDLFSIPNVWLRGWKSKILPLPKETTIPTQTVNAKKQIVTENKKTATMNQLELRTTFVEGVMKDVLMYDAAAPNQPAEEKIFGLPYSYDTLGMYYNKDLFRRANIAEAPLDWRTFQEDARKLTVLGEDDKTIVQSGAAIGGAANVRHYVHLLTAIMAQNGAMLADDYGYATFDRYTSATEGRSEPPAVEALAFYQSFAIPQSLAYVWNESMPDSLDAFITGKTAIYFGFPFDAQLIRRGAQKLDFGIASLPQIDPGRPGNMPVYPIEVVSKKTAHPNESWDFIQFAARADHVTAFLEATKRPTALRSLITKQLTDADIEPFAKQVLTARPWYKGADYAKVEEAFAALIAVRTTIERPTLHPWVAEAASTVSSTIR